MKFTVVSVLGEALEQGLLHGVVGRSFAKGLHSLDIVNPRSFASDLHQTIDDRPFGGGDGMLMMAEPLAQSLESLNLEPEAEVFMMSPQGEVWTDNLAKKVAQTSSLTLICGRYGGVDERFLQNYKIREVSIGDYVLSGGELAGAVIIDSIVRKTPGVLGHGLSAEQDSFGKNSLLEAPQFTRPREWKGMSVPALLLEGHHQKIEVYKEKLGWLITLQKRPELITENPGKTLKLREFLLSLSGEDQKSLGLHKEKLLQAMDGRSW